MGGITFYKSESESLGESVLDLVVTCRTNQARAEEQVKAEAKQALCRERMSMWLEDPVQRRFDKEDHERDVEWLRENCD